MIPRPAVLAAALALAGGPALAGPDLYSAIGQRLSLMQSVAAWKFARGVPVEDAERERVVIEVATASAAAKGLAADSVAPFFRAQIEAAKAIQTCWIARWQSGAVREPVETPDLSSTIRPELDELGDSIVEELRVALKSGARFDAGGAAGFSVAVGTDCLDEASAARIYTALGAVRLAK